MEAGTVLTDGKASVLVVAVQDGRALCVTAPTFDDMATILTTWSASRVVEVGTVRESKLDKLRPFGSAE